MPITGVLSCEHEWNVRQISRTEKMKNSFFMIRMALYWCRGVVSRIKIHKEGQEADNKDMKRICDVPFR